MHIRRLICLVATLAMPTIAMALDLPPIDKPLPYGSTVLEPLNAERINETTTRTVQLLTAELTRSNQPRERRAELISDLARTDLDAAVTSIVAAASDDDAVVRAAVGLGLAKLKRPAGADAVVKLATDTDPNVRAAAVTAAGAIGRGDLVTAGLNDADPIVVTAALAVATADQAPAITARLVSQDDGVRLLAIETIGRIGLASAGADVAKQLTTDVATQITALDALGKIKATAQGPAVVERLKHAHPSIRRAAIGALVGVLPASDAQSQSIAMLADGDESVRTAAALSLAKVPGPAAIEPLVKQLADGYKPLHIAAREALIAIGQPVIPAAVRLLDDPSPRRREDGSYVLGTLASHEGYARHVALLKDTDWAVVAQVAKSLGPIGDPTAGDPLTQTVVRATTASPPAASDPSGTLLIDRARAATNAIVSAGQLGHVPVGEVAAKLIPQRLTISSDVRAASVWVIGIVGCPDQDRVFGSFPGIIANLEESGDVKVEAVKAVGNRKYSKGLSWLNPESNPMLADGVMLALTHWSRDRIAGKVTPFELPPELWRADVSISDTTSK